MQTLNVATVALMRHGGSHLIRPIVSKLGFDIVEPGNFSAPLDQAVGPVIVFLRDPRDRMVSTLRWWRGKPRKIVMLGSDLSDDAQLRQLLEQRGFLAEMLVWADVWCNWTKTVPYKVRFESISSRVVGGIANHLSLPQDSERDKRIFTETYGHGRTYTGSHSNWRDSFGSLSIDYWNKNGGNDLINMMGYV